VTTILLWALAPAALLCFALLLAFSTALVLTGEKLRLWRRCGPAWALLTASVVFALCGPSFRGLNDETSFLNIANALWVTGKANSYPEWIWKSGELIPYFERLTFRPVLFPALLLIPRMLLGQSWMFGFALNFVVVAALFFFAFKRGDRGANFSSLFAILVLAANPVLCLSAASSGYDILSLGFAALSFVALYRYQASRDSILLGIAVFSAACFASTRIEGILAMALICLFAFPTARAGRSWTRDFSIILVGAILVLPVLVQRTTYYPHVDIKSAQDMVNWANVWPHAISFVSGFFLELFGPFPILTHAIGAVFLVGRWRSGWLNECKALLLFLSIYLLFLFLFHDGNLKLPFQARLYLPFSVALCLAAAEWLIVETRQRYRQLLSAAFLAQLAISLPVMQKGVVYFVPPIEEEFNAVKNFVASHEEKSIYIYLNPGPISAFGKAAIQPKTFDRNRDWFRQMVSEESLGPIYLIEAWPPQKGARPLTLEEGDSKLLQEVQMKHLRTLRFYEINASAVSRGPAPKSPQPQ